MTSQNFSMAELQIALVSASQRAQDKVSQYLAESTSATATITQTDSSGNPIATVTEFLFDLTNPTNSALFNSALNNLQLLNTYSTASLQALKSMIQTNISNLR